MTMPRQRLAHHLSDASISRLVEAFASITPGQLAALTAVREAARRGAAVAMLPGARERFDLGMAALEAIIEATGARR